MIIGFLNLPRPLIALAVALLLASCGGSGGSQTAGIDGSGAPVASNTSGTIDGFGSVIVNGVKYESNTAEILVNGQRASENDLRVGYQVSVTGNNNNGRSIAQKIEFIPSVVGEITALLTAEKQILVLGKTIQVTNNTVFDASIKPASLAGLSVGQTILVSGAIAPDGSISATRIERSNSTNLQISGQVANLTSSSFSVNGTTVVYTNAQLINLNRERLINGARVAAIGIMQDNQLQASTVIGLNKNLARDFASADIEGFITRFVSATDFDVDGVSATTTNQTRYEKGSPADLRLGVKIEVEGSINSSGVLVASDMEFEQTSNNKISGTVTAITLGNNTGNTTGIISGALEVDGTRVITTKQTRYEDKQFNLRPFNLSSLTRGDLVEVSGYSTAEGFIATKIERREVEDDDAETRELEGTISALGADYLVLFGRRIYLTENTRITGDSGETISLSNFLLLALNQQIELEVESRDGEFYALEIELELEDSDEAQTANNNAKQD
jgi:hypothetical protein